MAKGFTVFPAGANKRPLIKGWQDKASDDPAQIERWWKKWPNAMPALPTGSRNGIAVMDVDCKGERDGLAALALFNDVDAMSPVWITTPSGGRHIYFRPPEGMGNSAPVPYGVDVKAEGGFVIAPGAINGKGVYSITSGSLGDDLPEWPKTFLPQQKPAGQAKAEPSGRDFSVILSALSALPNDGDEFGGREDWLRIGMALHAETEGSLEGEEAWHDWSAQHPSYDTTKTDEAWASFTADKEGGVTGKTIIAEAERRGWRDTSMLTDEDVETAAWTMAEIDRILEENRQTRSRGGLRLLKPRDCAEMPAREYVIKGLLAERDVGAIIGAPGSGKSVIAPYLGYAVARGVEAFDRRTKAGGVFYVAAEDALGLRKRVTALRDQHGEADGFHLVEGVTNLASVEDSRALRQAVKQHRPSLIIIDTLAAAFPGLEENESKAMGKVVSVARSLTQWGAAVLLIHHDTKAGDGLPRGHSILNGALDVSLHLRREKRLVEVRPSKNRNGTTDQSLAFSVGEIQLGTDADGDPITAPICDDESGPVVRDTATRLPASAKAALEILEALSEGGKCVTKSDWRKACVDSDAVSGAEKPDDRRKAFRRALEELARRQLFHSEGEIIHLPDAPEMLLGDEDV
ncbi:AAA family ATPase [Vannielia litorea]|uniref:AAA family ATPase n=1 Tax=Vannielia litorea TaxID=1217970 RepID=UPI001FE9464B|nr:AAA family ATPase [Vannielia litorea]